MLELTDEELCLVALASTDGVGAATMRSLLREARSRGVPLHTVVELPPDELAGSVGLSRSAAGAVAALRSPRLAGRSVLERLLRLGAGVVLAGRPEYPDRLCTFLGDAAPRVLFTVGDVSLLQRPSVAIVGSRRPSDAARRAVDLLATDQAADGTVVVSGGARGIDAAAHRAGLRSGATVVLPPVGLARFRWPGVDRGEVPEGRWCAAGQFPPHSSWRAEHALLRNRLIVALSDAVVAFEPRDSGGTWHSCLTSLRMRKPLYVVTASPRGAKRRGLRRLVRMGATTLDPACMPGAAAFARLVADYSPPPSAAQVELFGEPDRPGENGRRRV